MLFHSILYKLNSFILIAISKEFFYLLNSSIFILSSLSPLFLPLFFFFSPLFNIAVMELCKIQSFIFLKFNINNTIQNIIKIDTEKIIKVFALLFLD